MAAQKKIRNIKSGYAIAVIHPDDSVGFLTAPDGMVETYPTKAAAEDAMERKRMDKRYTWSLPIEVRKYDRSKEVMLD